MSLHICIFKALMLLFQEGDEDLRGAYVVSRVQVPFDRRTSLLGLRGLKGQRRVYSAREPMRILKMFPKDKPRQHRHSGNKASSVKQRQEASFCANILLQTWTCLQQSHRKWARARGFIFPSLAWGLHFSEMDQHRFTPVKLSTVGAERSIFSIFFFYFYVLHAVHGWLCGG